MEHQSTRADSVHENDKGPEDIGGALVASPSDPTVLQAETSLGLMEFPWELSVLPASVHPGHCGMSLNF